MCWSFLYCSDFENLWMERSAHISRSFFLINLRVRLSPIKSAFSSLVKGSGSINIEKYYMWWCVLGMRLFLCNIFFLGWRGKAWLAGSLPKVRKRAVRNLLVQKYNNGLLSFFLAANWEWLFSLFFERNFKKFKNKRRKGRKGQGVKLWVQSIVVKFLYQRKWKIDTGSFFSSKPRSFQYTLAPHLVNS